MATATATPMAALEEVAARLADRQTKFSALQRELEAASQEAASLKALREKFLIPASAGDKAAKAHVEELERRQQVVSRQIEGLQLRLQSAEREFREVETEHIRISREIGEARAAARAKEIAAEAMRLVHNVMALFRSTCRAMYDLCEYLKTNVESGREIDETQKSHIITAVRQTLRVNFWNETWQHSTCQLGLASLVTKNACPPANLRHLEKLQ
jgi:chromosome segregation ATPase